jgi:hypothetical protein
MRFLDRLHAHTLAILALLAVFVTATVVSPHLPYTTLHAQQTGPGGVPGAGAGGGAVASVFGRTGAVVAASGDYTAAQVTDAAATNTANTFTAAGAASVPAVGYSGAPFAGGTGTTTVPLLYSNFSGASPSTWSTSGTVFGINAVSTFGGNFLDFHVAGGSSVFSVSDTGRFADAGGAVLARSTSDSVAVLTTSTTGTGDQADFGSSSKVTNSGAAQFLTYLTVITCSSKASPAACSSAPSGTVAVPASGATLVVDSTAVTANSQIQLTFDSSLGTKLGVTCNTTIQQPTVSARTVGTSFTIAMPSTVITNPDCISYLIFN